MTITVNDEALPPLPPDPSEVAPSLDPTVATTVYAGTEFLYTGSNPIQTGVAPGTMEPRRTTVLSGQVLDRNNAAIAGATIRILNHPEYGQTLSRADGRYDMAVNGGGPLTVSYQREGYLPAQRTVQVPWQDYVLLPKVVLVPLDAQATPIDLADTTQPIQVAQGAPVTDADGTRQATVFFPQGTAATMVLPDGSTQSLTTLTVRATEYTVGPEGPEAMPAPLPPTSAYTYAFELSVDEALAAGAKQVDFDQPVPFYVDNFLDFPVGMVVPTGYYDRDQAAWIPSDNGRVIRVMSITGGLVDLDTDGDNAIDDAATLATLGITDAERAQLATLYAAGKTLWRVPIAHFTPWDCNWPYGPPDDAEPPGQPPPDNDDGQPPPNNGPEPDPDKQCNSVIECQNQILREAVAITGTPFRLHYASDRVPGRRSDLWIPLSSDTVPVSLKRIDLEVEVAGQLFTQQTFEAKPNQNFTTLDSTSTWDDMVDAYGRIPQGTQPALVRIGYVYDAVYAEPAQSPQSFGFFSGIPITGNPARQEITLWQDHPTSIRYWDARGQGLGGWTLDVHHAYDPVGQILYLGNGSRRGIGAAPIVTTVAGNGEPGYSGDGGPATEAGVPSPNEVEVGPDGSLYILDGYGGYTVRRVTPDGIISTVAGGGSCSSVDVGDGGPATEACLSGSRGIGLGPDGSLYIGQKYSYTDYIRRVWPDGIITTVAGGNSEGYSGDGGPATEASFDYPADVAIGPDGSLYIADRGNHAIRRVGLDGIITTVAGGNGPGSIYQPIGDGGPATEARLNQPTGVVFGPDGSLYIADYQNFRIRRVNPDGIITTVAGNGAYGSTGDGGSATEARIWAWDLALGPDGSVYIADGPEHRIRRVSPDGIITTVAGSGTKGYRGDGSPATQASFNVAGSVAVGPDGNVYITDRDNNRIRRVAPALPGLDLVLDEIPIAAEDGSEVYVFDYTGRHLRTVHALTAAVLYAFAYDADGHLASVTDGDGNVTSIEHDADGNPTAIVAPFGQQTTLSTDDNGYLASLANPAGETYQMGYTSDGLLTGFTDPNGNTSTMDYNARGRLVKDTNAEGGFWSLARTNFDDAYEVDLTSALGQTTTYRIESLSTDDQQRFNTFPDGTQTDTLIGTDGSWTTAFADGTLSDRLEGPDPRFAMQAPLTSSLAITTGGLTATATVERSVTLADAKDPFSLTALTDKLTLNGRTVTRAYEAATQTATTTSEGERNSTTVIDSLGRITQAQIAGLLAIDLTYDAGRLNSITQGTGADARTTTFSYNAAGYLQTVTDAIGDVSSYEHDTTGRVVTETGPDGQRILFDYDAKGNLTSLTPPGRPAHTFSYSPVDLLTQYTPPDVGIGDTSTTYAYNADKQLTQITRPSPDGLTLSFAYDGAGRLSTLTLPDGQLSYGYDATTGKLSSVTNPDGTVSYSYNGRLLTQTSWSGAITGNVSRTYDNDFRLVSLSVNGANPIAYQYDADSLLIEAGDLTLNRDAQNGLLTNTTLGNVSDSLSYNGFGELLGYSAQYAGSALFATQYTRDALGRIIQKAETIGGITTTFDYSYDAAGRLIEVKENGAAVSSYSYDANGNRLSGPGLTVAPAYDDQDRLLTFADATYTYTANGELETKTEGAQITTYSYDVLGNLRTVTLSDGQTLDYVIDGANRRIGKKIYGVLVQGFLYQDQLKPIAELDGSGQVVSRFVYATGINIPDYMIKGGVTYRIITDHLGSPRFVVDVATGTIAQQMDYDEFGNVLQDTNPGFQPFGFAGGLYDPETGLVRFGARDYDPRTGRWTAKDPLIQDSRIYQLNLLSAMGTNLYTYINNNSISMTDPMGLIWPYDTPSWITHLGTSAAGILCARGVPTACLAYVIGTAYGQYQMSTIVEQACEFIEEMGWADVISKWKQGTSHVPELDEFKKHYGDPGGPSIDRYWPRQKPKVSDDSNEAQR